MIWLSRTVYRFLLWRERRLARKDEPLRQSRNSAGKQRKREEVAHLQRGRRGELLAYWYLRQAGYTVVARNRRPGAPREHQPGPIPGELDLVAWDGPMLAFVEVKTRASMEVQPDVRVVQVAQRQRIAKAAAGYIRRLKLSGRVNYRFDVVVVAWNAATGYSVKLIKGAYKVTGSRRKVS